MVIQAGRVVTTFAGVRREGQAVVGAGPTAIVVNPVSGLVYVGNQGGVTYPQTWDAENRPTVVTNTATTPNAVSKFVYDGAGARALQVQISGTVKGVNEYAANTRLACPRRFASDRACGALREHRMCPMTPFPRGTGCLMDHVSASGD